MNKVTELENTLTELFRKGTEVGYSETEIDEFLENIDYDNHIRHDITSLSVFYRLHDVLQGAVHSLTDF